jgi:uncharacterized membrane protein
MSATVSPAANDPAAPKLILPGESLPAGAGMNWISEGWKLFTRAPLMWIVLLVLVFIAAVVVSFVPIIGSLAFQILSPVIAGGFVLGCFSLENNGELELDHAIAGFKRNFAGLAVVGVIYVVGMIVLVLIFAVFVGASLIPALLMGGDPDTALAALSAGGGALLLGTLVVTALSVLLFAAYWFAPALVVMHGLGAIEAMKASFFACFRNFVPFLVYGVIMFLLSIVAIIPFGLGMLVWVPVMITSTYIAYRQIFTEH